ncbi:MAG: hypothetical protein AAGA54_01005 [Myxococcota bacterium]
MSDPSAATRPRGLLVLLVLLVTGVSPYFGRFMNANERPRLLQGMAWVDEGSHAIDGPSARGIAAGIDVSQTPQGRLVPNKPPGTTVVAAGAYGSARFVRGDDLTLGEYTAWARLLGGAIPMALVLWLGAVRLRGRGVTFALVAYALATPALAYARLLYGHQLAAALLFAGVVLLDRAVTKRSIPLGAFAGALAGAAVGVEYLAAFAGLPIGMWLLWDASRTRRAALMFAALAGALVPVALLAGYHDAVFGSPWTTPYHAVVREGFAEIHGRGLLGLTWPTSTSLFEHLVSPWGGLLYWAPLSVLAVAASIRAVAARKASAFEVLSLGIVVWMMLLNVCLAQTGGWRVGPRYLVVALPFLLPGLARLWSGMRHAVAGSLVVALLGWSMFVNFLAAGLFPHLVPEGNPLMDLLLPLWSEGLRPHAPWGRWALDACGVGTLVAFVIATRPRTDAARTSWVLGVVGACVLVGAGMLVPGAPAAEDSLAAIRGIWEPGGTRPPKDRVLGGLQE